jgi:hypothetical protein
MAFSISGYSKIGLLDVVLFSESKTYPHPYVWVDLKDNDPFQEHAAGLTHGAMYSFEKSYHYAGFGSYPGFGNESYNSFGHFQNFLSERVLGVKRAEIFQKPDDYRDIPFFWFLWFPSDRSSTMYMDDRTASRILLDFSQQRSNILRSVHRSDSWFYHNCNELIKVFQLGAESGLVAVNG